MFEPREIVVGHEEVWNLLEATLKAKGLYLALGPTQDEGDTPWYFIGVKNLH